MNESRTFPDELRGGPSRPPLGEELLPPVEQPSAKFIMQLFIVPALIVFGIVAAWLTISWLVRTATLDPESLIKGIENGPSVARWQRTNELAELLHKKDYAGLKRDPKAATQLAQILDREIDRTGGGNDSQEDATLRVFVALAIGEFEVQEGTDVLVKAAETKRTQQDEIVRQRAIEAIATRAFNLQQLDPPAQIADENVEAALNRLVDEDDPEIRQRAAYAIGKLGTPTSAKKMEELIDNSDPVTRYNAAIALAHQGNEKAELTLAEMLDLDELAKLPQNAEDGPDVKAVIILSALDAAHALARQKPEANLPHVMKALDDLVAADDKKLDAAHVSKQVIADAAQANKLLKAHQ